MFVNAHAHLSIDENLDKALIDIVEHKIVFVSCSVDIPSYKEALKIAERSEWILPAFGIHPSRAHHYADKLDMLKDFLDTCLMMGEIGLDHFFVKNTSTYPLQTCVFEQFLKAAEQHKKIVNLHIRDAYHEALELLDTFSVTNVIIHCYDGPLEMVHRLADRGVYFSISFTILDKYKDKIPPRKDMRAAAKAVPSDLLLTETDGINPERMPFSTLNDVVRTLAVLRKSSPEEVTAQVRNNFVTLMKGDTRLESFAALLHAGNVL